MKDEQPDLAIIGCLPKDEMPIPPADYDNPCEGNCEQCNMKVWLSDKKKAVKLVLPNSIYLCMYCAVKLMTQNKSLEEIKVFNIGEGDSRSDEEKKEPLPWQNPVVEEEDKDEDKGTDLEM